MVKKILKISIQVILSIGIAFLLIWYALKDTNIISLFERFQEANFLYIFISFIFLIISHISRSMRWQILYKPLKYNPSVASCFFALMSGYGANLASPIPRVGEGLRCWILLRKEKIPLTTSIGTVVAERIVDLIMLGILFIIAFFIEFKRLNQFFMDLLNNKFKSINSLSIIFYFSFGVALVVGVILYFIYKRFKDQLHSNALFSKVFSFTKTIFEGIISMGKIKEKGAFIFHTLLIWSMYYAASFIVVYALPQTSNLTVLAGFSILIMGSLGMAAPVMGGIGAFHLLVSAVLVLYGINKDDGLLFATLVHSSQYLFTLIVGVICFTFSLFVQKNVVKTHYEYSGENI